MILGWLSLIFIAVNAIKSGGYRPVLEVSSDSNEMDDAVDMMIILIMRLGCYQGLASAI